jgi:steroid delta-isomerase-like uncharacterized protein
MKKTSLLLLTSCLLLAFSCAEQAPKTDAPVSSGAAKLENRFEEKVVNAHDATALKDLLGEDFVSHHFPAPGNNNKATFIEGMTSLFAGFPDIKITRLEQYEQGDKVFTYAFWEGTHTGVFMGIPATNKKAHVEYMDIWRVKDGKISENWVVMDIAGLLIQLGVMPPPGSPAK